MKKSTSGYQWWIIFLLWTVCIINTLDQAAIGVAAPYLMKELNMSPVAMGGILSAFWAAYCFMNIPIGFLADRWGAKKTYAVATFCWSAFTVMTGVANSYIAMMMARLGLGASEAALQPINLKVIRENFNADQRATATGLFNSGKRVGLAIVPILMTWLMAIYNWRIAFYIIGICTVVWVVMWWFTFRENKEAVSAAAAQKIPWKQLATNRSILCIFISKFFQDYLYILFVSWLPTYLVQDRGFTMLKMGWYASIPWILTMCALPLVGILSDYLIKRGVSITNSRKGIIIGGHLISSCVVFAVYTTDMMTAMVVMTIAVVCESAASTILLVAACELAPPNMAGGVVGFVNTAGGLAGMVAPIISGWLMAATGNFQQAFSLAAVFIVIAALFMWKGVGKIQPIQLVDDNDKKCCAV